MGEIELTPAHQFTAMCERLTRYPISDTLKQLRTAVHTSFNSLTVFALFPAFSQQQRAGLASRLAAVVPGSSPLSVLFKD